MKLKICALFSPYFRANSNHQLFKQETENIDAMISDKESIINDLTDYKKSLIYEVVTGKRKVV